MLPVRQPEGAKVKLRSALQYVRQGWYVFDRGIWIIVTVAITDSALYWSNKRFNHYYPWYIDDLRWILMTWFNILTIYVDFHNSM